MNLKKFGASLLALGMLAGTPRIAQAVGEIWNLTACNGGHSASSFSSCVENAVRGALLFEDVPGGLSGDYCGIDLGTMRSECFQVSVGGTQFAPQISMQPVPTPPVVEDTLLNLAFMLQANPSIFSSNSFQSRTDINNIPGDHDPARVAVSGPFSSERNNFMRDARDCLGRLSCIDSLDPVLAGLARENLKLTGLGASLLGFGASVNWQHMEAKLPSELKVLFCSEGGACLVLEFSEGSWKFAGTLTDRGARLPDETARSGRVGYDFRDGESVWRALRNAGFDEGFRDHEWFRDPLPTGRVGYACQIVGERVTNCRWESSDPADR